MSEPTIDHYWGFFRKEDPKPLDHISNKRLRKYVAEIGELRFSMFHIEGAKKKLADQGSRFPTGNAGNDKWDGSAKEIDSADSAKKIGAAGAEIRANTVCSWPPMVLPKDAQSCYPNVVQIFAYGAQSPSEDAEVRDEEIDSDDYAGQCLLEVAAYLSISAGKQVSVAMTVDRLHEEIKSDESYKYIRQIIVGTVSISKFVGKLAVYNYHKDNLTLSPEGLIMFKGSRFLVPETLRPGLLRALHTGHAGVVSMITRAKEAFWWPGLKTDIESVRANCLVCHENAPSQPKQPSMGVLKTKYAYEALSMDHFFLKGVEFLAIVDRHSGMLSVHCTAHRGTKELIRILRVHC